MTMATLMKRHRPFTPMRWKKKSIALTSPLKKAEVDPCPSSNTLSSLSSDSTSLRPCLRRRELAFAADGSFALPNEETNIPGTITIHRPAPHHDMHFFYARIMNSLPSGFNKKKRKHHATAVRFNERSNEYHDSQELTDEECSSYWYNEQEIRDMIRYYCECVHFHECFED